MESRLGDTLRLTRETAKRITITAAKPANKVAEVAQPAGSAAERAEAVAPVEVTLPVEEAGEASWPDESAESAFLSEARERGETVVPAKSREEMPDETNSKALPSLSELVERIPPEVRETLDDLFRAKFTTVRRIPRQALKG